MVPLVWCGQSSAPTFHRRQSAVGPQLTTANKILMEQAGVDHNAQRHEAVHRGLKFQQQIHIKPLLAPAYSPNGIAVPAAQVVSNVAAVHLLQGIQVQRRDPLFRQEANQQILDHPVVREEQLVDSVVLVHGHLANGYRRAWRRRAGLSVLRCGQSS